MARVAKNSTSNSLWHLLHLEKNASQVCFIFPLLIVLFRGFCPNTAVEIRDSGAQRLNGSATHWQLTGVP